VGGATSVLEPRRAAALAALLAALVTYVAVADRLWEAPSWLGALVVGLLLLPSYTAAVWLGLPLWRDEFVRVLAAGLVLFGVWIGLDVAGLDALANTTRLASYAVLGYWLLTLFEELWWVALVALLIPWVDIWSVATGPTKYVTEKQPDFFFHVSVGLPTPGGGGINIGPPDIIFFALFLAAADRFGLRIGWTWVAMTGLLAVTLFLVWWWADSGLPALPAVCFGFLLPNADLIYRHAREVRAASRAAPS
jgi:hypothetical protein